MFNPEREETMALTESTTTARRARKPQLVLEEQWVEVQDALQAHIGADCAKEWFGSAHLQGVVGTTVRLSVPTHFIERWITKHYQDLLLALWQRTRSNVEKIDLEVRTLGRFRLPDVPRTPVPKPAPPAVVAPPPPPVFVVPPRNPSRLSPKRGRDGRVNITYVQQIVCRHYGVELEEMLGEGRRTLLVRVRHVGVYESFKHMPDKLRPRSKGLIGRKFGLDHTSVGYAIKKMTQMIEEDPAFAEEIQKIEAELGL